ncbi:MAG: PfkB family carbohydrate kinase, partial [Anaerolineales bacterium]
LQSLRAEGINTDAVAVDPQHSTGVALITVDKNGDNTIVVAPGANSALSPQDIRDQQAIFEANDVLITQLECPLETVETAIQLARENGLKTILNPAPAKVLGAGLLSQVDFLIPNQNEIQLLTAEQDFTKGILKLEQQGVSNVIVTLGDQGVLFREGGKIYHLHAYPVKAVDTTAAGDAFVGAFAIGIAMGKAISDAVRMGNAAGALAVQKAGAQPSLPTRAELERFMQEQQQPSLELFLD